MDKLYKILLLSYSQTGQLNEITDNFAGELRNVDIDRVQYHPVTPFPFPWTSKAFFDCMPECVLETAVPLQNINYKYSKYDLIVFAYQPWFLSPSIPASSILQDKTFLSLLQNTPVITLIGSRNMWLNSQASVKKRITEAGGYIVGNVPFVDRNQNQISAVTILHWMLKGTKTRKYGMFPKPGVNEKDIQSASQFGSILNQAIEKNELSDLQTKFLNLGLITLPTDILFIEERAKRLFSIWANLIRKYGTTQKGKTRVATAFKYYLLIALFIVAPIVILVYQIFIAPFTSKSINKKKQIYLQ